MAFQCFNKRGAQRSSGGGEDNQPQLKSSKIVDVQSDTNWDNITCPICLDSPHNSVLLQCSSYGKGCRAFVCDTNHLHSNCLERFKTAYGVPLGSKFPSISDTPETAYGVPLESKSPSTSDTPPDNMNLGPVIPETHNKPNCPLCRGDVNGWVIVEKTRKFLDQKKRCCEEEGCPFVGSYMELHKHALREHPNSFPSKIDPIRKLDWENFQQSSEIVDVLSTIHSEVPRGVVLGDYVIEYGDDNTDEFEDFPGDEGNWWTSCILYQMFDNFRSTRNRRRSRASDTRRESRRSSYDTSNSDEGSVTSIEFPDYRGDETGEVFVTTRGPSRSSSNHRSYRRRRSRFNDH